MKSKLYFVVLFTLFCFAGNSQNQIKADSLLRIYHIKNSNDLELLKKITEHDTRPDTTLHYAQILLKEAKAQKDQEYVLSALMQIGNAYQRKGDYIKTLEAYFKAMELSQDLKKSEVAARLMISIGDTYASNGNTANAEKYYKEGIDIIRNSHDSLSLGRALINTGEELFFAGKHNEALKNYEEAGVIFENIGYQTGTAYKIGNEGMVYADLGKNELALSKINEAIDILEELKDYYAISIYLTVVADIYADNQQYETALEYANRSLKLAASYGLKEEIVDANFKLSEIYEKQGDPASALDFYKKYVVYRDSIQNLETVRRMANMNTAFQVSQKQSELDIVSEKQKTQKTIAIAAVGIIVLIALLAFGLYRRNNFIRKTNIVLEKEKNRSDHLLRNILPQDTARELKDSGKVTAKRFDSVSVLFADFKGFTLHAEHLSPEDLVTSIDYYFSKFDDIIEKHGVEKIKTLGDCYMCVCGLPYPEENHAQKLILAAKEFLEFVRSAKDDNPENTTRFDLRVGISSGPVVAGVVGKKKFAYDIWGDTVNIASRMESASEIDKINISEDTYKRVKTDFHCSYRGEIMVKNKGMMKMYFVEGQKSETIRELQETLVKQELA